MKIKWLGHACFLITAQDGRTLLTDPFDETVGYPLPGVHANVVTCSHDHFDHHAIETLPLGYTVIDDAGVHHSNGFVVEGISSFHDDQQGSLRGRNIVYVFEVDKLKVAHMGDLGHQPTPAMIERLKGVDVMFMPVGGVFTLDGDQAAQAVNTLKPRVAIPMHYQTRHLNFRLTDEQPFLRHFEYRRLEGNELEVTPQNIGDLPPVVVMAYQ